MILFRCSNSEMVFHLFFTLRESNMKTVCFVKNQHETFERWRKHIHIDYNVHWIHVTQWFECGSKCHFRYCCVVCSSIPHSSVQIDCCVLVIAFVICDNNNKRSMINRNDVTNVGESTLWFPHHFGEHHKNSFINRFFIIMLFVRCTTLWMFVHTFISTPYKELISFK